MCTLVLQLRCNDAGIAVQCIDGNECSFVLSISDGFEAREDDFGQRARDVASWSGGDLSGREAKVSEGNECNGEAHSMTRIEACSSGAGPPPSKRLRLSRNRQACSSKRTPLVSSLSIFSLSLTDLIGMAIV